MLEYMFSVCSLELRQNTAARWIWSS